MRGKGNVKAFRNPVLRYPNEFAMRRIRVDGLCGPPPGDENFWGGRKLKRKHIDTGARAGKPSVLSCDPIDLWREPLPCLPGRVTPRATDKRLPKAGRRGTQTWSVKETFLSVVAKDDKLSHVTERRAKALLCSRPSFHHAHTDTEGGPRSLKPARTRDKL